MKHFSGIWVDHKKAYIVTFTGAEYNHEKQHQTETVTKIVSDVERRVRLSGGSRTRTTPWGPQEVAVDGKMEDRCKQQLKKYYRELIKIVRQADKILIMGPGEAKKELKKEIEKSKELAKKIVKVETQDKMTERQMIARVRSFFELV
jgi:stalled ribosome rescue protein Dom34